MKDFLIGLMAVLLFIGAFAVALAQEESLGASKKMQYKTESLTGNIISMNRDTGHVTIQEGNGVEKTFRTDPGQVTYLKDGDSVRVVLKSVSNIAEDFEIIRS